LKDNSGSDDDSFKIDGVDVATVTVVAKIISIQDTSTKLNLVVDDNTARIDATSWKDDGVDVAMGIDWQVGSYVRIYGTLRTFEKKKSINAHSIRAIRDYNEITYHNLKCIFEHLHLTKGMPPAGPQAGAGAAPSPMGAYGAKAAAPQGGYGGSYSTAPTMPVASAAPAGASLHDQILQIYRSTPHGDDGVAIDTVLQGLRQRGVSCSMQQLMEAVELLSNEGHLYETYDDKHHKPV